MDEKDLQIIASNLTIAFYNGQIRREPFLGEDRRAKFYSPDDENRIPTISRKEVFSVFEGFMKMLKQNKK